MDEVISVSIKSLYLSFSRLHIKRKEAYMRVYHKSSQDLDFQDVASHASASITGVDDALISDQRQLYLSSHLCICGGDIILLSE